MLISMKEMLAPTREHRFAIGAFNVADSCFIRAVVEEAGPPLFLSIRANWNLSPMNFLATCANAP